MPVDPAAQAVLDILNAPGVPPLDELPLDAARTAYDQLAGFAGELTPVRLMTEHSAGSVPVRVCWPEGNGPHPVLIWVHGGGGVLGSAAGYDPQARDLCVRANCIVVNVDYRLAPEHPFPAGLNDVRTVAEWVLTDLPDLGGDPHRVAVAGDSAGANLAAVLANELPGAFRLQALIYPVVDMTMSYPSISENGDGLLLTRAAMTWFLNQYLDGADPQDPRASPIYAEQAVLAKAPPALVITAEFDPLRDEGEAYRDRLRAAGVPVEHQRYDGMIHAFYAMRGMIPAANDALDQVAAALLRAWTH